jgi:type II secretory ATPase GspE/PulE/Tfp pilus assembly ATPase PilB-like protein
MVEKIIIDAYHARASDIHIDVAEDALIVKYRIDGELETKETFPKHFHNDVVGRIKILAQLRTDEHMIPQDGRFRIDLESTQEKAACHLDVRVSIVPAYYGESIVMRLLTDTTSASSLNELGFSEHDQRTIVKMLSRSSGMILITGPTGSGKTTTLYTLLKMLNDGKRSIITIEDPIEYALAGTRQIQANYERGLTFATGLRSIVRQDPDIIMVGEIRDAETAHIAIHTALTGHLLLSTLHTNDAASAIPRLIDMGIDPYLIASTLGIVIGQRLVRKTVNKEYQGRVGLFEVLNTEDTLRDAIMHKAPARVLQKIAEEHGMHTLEQDGLEKVERGITSIEEVLSAIIQ